MNYRPERVTEAPGFVASWLTVQVASGPLALWLLPRVEAGLMGVCLAICVLDTDLCGLHQHCPSASRAVTGHSEMYSSSLKSSVWCWEAWSMLPELRSARFREQHGSPMPASELGDGSAGRAPCIKSSVGRRILSGSPIPFSEGT